MSDTTYRKDAGPKLRAYAAAGISDYWIVNLTKQQVEVYGQPENVTDKRSDWRYASITTHSASETLSPHRRPDLAFSVGEILVGT